MSKTFVTGSLGFIGQHLTPFLKREGLDVLTCDLHTRGYEGYTRSDVTSYLELSNIFKKHEIDTVIHMAGEVGRIMGEMYPHKMIEVNALGTLNLIKLCLEYNAKLVNFSTSEVHGKQFGVGSEKLIEEMVDYASALGCTNVYAISKLYAEALVKHYVDNYGLKAVTIRPFMIYGENERPSPYRSALIQFINNAFNGKPLTVHRGTSRAWCHVSDFVKGLKLVLDQSLHDYYEAYNIGSEEYHTMKESAEIVIVETGSKSKVDLVDPPKRFLSRNKYFSIDKMKRIGYSPQVSLREGISRMVKFHRERRGENTDQLF